MKHFSLKGGEKKKGGEGEGGGIFTMQKHLLTATLAKCKVERLVQEPFLACVDLERKIASH